MENTENILKFHYSKYLDDDIGLNFAPYFIGREKCNPLKPPSAHLIENQYTFHYILSGCGYLEQGNKKIRLCADDIFFFPPNKNDCNRDCIYYPDKQDPWEYIWFNLVGEGTENLLKCIKMTPKENFYSVQNPAILRQQLTEMSAISMNTEKRNVSYYLPYIMKFFAEIADEKKLGKGYITDKEKKVKEIVDMIEHNYTDPNFSIRQIADALFYTTAYISRIFKEVTNMTPVEYLTSLRMLKARDLLYSHAYNVSQIAYSVGYNSPFYFSKEFKKYFGFSPSQFKE